MINVIGVAGKKRHGKDTFGKMLAKHLGFETVSFAEELYCEVALATGVPIETIKQNKDVFRPMLQWWGTEFRRKYGNDDNYWVDILDLEITSKLVLRETEGVVITDVRFMNEANYVQKDRRGMLILVGRPYVEDTADPHVSETLPDIYKDWDYVVVNCGSLEDLDRVAQTIAEAVKESSTT